MSIGDWLGNQFSGTPNPNGGTDYLGGLINYTPPPTGAPNYFGLFGATMKDMGAELGGHPADANNLDAYQQLQRQLQMQKGYSSALGTMFAPGGDPNSVSVTPQIRPDASGAPIQNDPGLYQQPAQTAPGPLAGRSAMLPLLKSLPADQGIPALMSMMAPHGFDTVTDAQGVVHKIDKVTGEDLGTIGNPKVQEFDPTKTYAVSDSSGGQAQPSMLAAPAPPQSVAATNIANNNPGNLKNPRGKGFQSFPTPEAGANAVTNQLSLYGKRGLNTVASIVSTYAPPSDGNDTVGYTASVAKQLGISPSAPLNMNDPQTLQKLTQAMIRQEQGGTPVANASSQPSATPSPQIPGYRVLSQGKPQWRMITDPNEAKSLGVNVGSQVNSVTGEVKPISMSDVPIGADDPSIQAAGANFFKTGQMGNSGRDSASVRAIRAAAVQYGMQQNPGMSPADVGVMMSRNAQDYSTGTKALSAFMTGKQGQQITAANNAIGHLGVLGDYATALGNGDVQTLNALKQRFEQEFGKSAPTNFSALAQIAGPEVVKAVVNNGGGQGDREEVSATLSKAGSPAQLAGTIKTYQVALGRQLQDAAIAYRNSTHRNDFERVLAPDVVPIFNQAKPSAPLPQNLPRLGQQQPTIIKYDAQGNRIQ